MRESVVPMHDLDGRATLGLAVMIVLNLALICFAWVCWYDGRPFVAGLLASIPFGCIARVLFNKATGV